MAPCLMTAFFLVKLAKLKFIDVGWRKLPGSFLNNPLITYNQAVSPLISYKTWMCFRKFSNLHRSDISYKYLENSQDKSLQHVHPLPALSPTFPLLQPDQSTEQIQERPHWYHGYWNKRSLPTHKSRWLVSHTSERPKHFRGPNRLNYLCSYSGSGFPYLTPTTKKNILKRSP